MTVRQTYDFITSMKLTGSRAQIAGEVLKEIKNRLTFLLDVGLDYLTLHRAARHALGRRSAAHPARVAARQRAVGRALRARRAVDRSAPARQRAADPHAASPARPRQHGARRRARRSDDRSGGLGRRLRPRRGPPRRQGRRRRHARRHQAGREVDHGPLPVGRREDRGSRDASPAVELGDARRARASTTSRTSRRRFRSA